MSGSGRGTAGIDARFRAAFADLLSSWVDLMRRHALATLAVVAATTVGVGLYTARHLGVDAELDSLFSDKLPHRVLQIEYERAFPALSSNIVVVVDGRTPEQASAAAAALAEKMENAPQYFASVYLPRGAFFEDHALLYMSTKELQDFADRLARVQPYIAGLAEDGTLRGLANMLERGLAAVREGDIEGEELVPMLDRFGAAIRAYLHGEPYRLSWAEVVAGHDFDVDARRRFVIARAVADYSQVLAGEKPLKAVRRFARDLHLDEDHGVRVRITGNVALSYEELLVARDQASIAGAVSFALVGLLLVLALRSVRLVVALLVTLAVGLMWTLGFAAVAIGHLNLISVAFAVLFIGLGVDFGIHIGMRYQELLGLGRSHADALRETVRGVGGSVALCAITTAIGFYAFVPTDFRGVAELGLISGTGMFISLFFTFTLMPALMTIGLGRGAPRAARVRAMKTKLMPRLPDIGHPRAVMTAAIVLGAAGVLLLGKIRFEGNPLEARDPSAESVQTFEELISSGGRSPWTVSVIMPDLASAQAIAKKMRALYEVDEAVSLKDYVPDDQDEKLAIIEDVSMFLAPPPAPGGKAAPVRTSEQVAALHGLDVEAGHLLAEGGDPEVVASVRGLRSDFDHLFERIGDSHAAAAEAVSALQTGLLATLPDQLHTLRRVLDVDPITMADLPRGLLERMVSKKGDVRVEIFPKEDMRDEHALERFVDAVRTVSPNVTGGAIDIYESGRAVVRALRQAMIAAAIVIALLLLVIWRTVRDTLLVMIPLAFAAVLTGATAVLLGIPFNFADVIVLPLLLGIGVDSGIHLVHRWHLSRKGAGDLLETSTARAVIFSALTTIASFGSLAFTTHRGMASMGQLLTVGVALTVICNVVLLPALIELREKR
jgi:hopanoid biosynthesis associated RND transporter like protein HpnN